MSTTRHSLQLLLTVSFIIGCALGAAISSTASSSSSSISNTKVDYIGIGLRSATRPLHLAIGQCRQRCYRQALLFATPPALCRASPDCFMCHDYCRVLAVAEWSLASSMCADRVFCSQGCRIACEFHRLRTAETRWLPNAVQKREVHHISPAT